MQMEKLGTKAAGNLSAAESGNRRWMGAGTKATPLIRRRQCIHKNLGSDFVDSFQQENVVQHFQQQLAAV